MDELPKPSYDDWRSFDKAMAELDKERAKQRTIEALDAHAEDVETQRHPHWARNSILHSILLYGLLVTGVILDLLGATGAGSVILVFLILFVVGYAAWGFNNDRHRR